MLNTVLPYAKARRAFLQFCKLAEKQQNIIDKQKNRCYTESDSRAIFYIYPIIIIDVIHLII